MSTEKSQISKFRDNLEKIDKLEKFVTAEKQTLGTEDVAFVISRWTIRHRGPG